MTPILGIVTPACMEVIGTVPALAAADAPTLAFDRLDVYRAALDFAALA